MLAELLHTASLMDQAVIAHPDSGHKSGFRLLEAEANLFDAMENMRRELT